MSRSKKIWRKNFDIRRVDLQMPWPVMHEFYRSQVRFLGRAYFHEAIWVNEKMDNVATYFLKDELRVFVEAILKKILTQPKVIDQLHQKTIELNKRYFALAKKVEKLNYSRLTNKELTQLYEKMIKAQADSHGIALPTTWFVDADEEDFSKYLLSFLSTRIKEKDLRLSLTEVFSVLSTPHKDSMARAEEKELLGLVATLQQGGIAKYFTSVQSEQLLKMFEALPANIQRKINHHYKKWRWTPYTYIGPAYDLSYYLEVIRGLLREKVKPSRELQRFVAEKAKTKKQQQVFRRKLAITSSEWKLFVIAQDIIFLKGYRKDCLYYGGYVRDLLLAEVAKRLHLSVMQAKHLLPEEVPSALQKGFCDASVLNQRMRSNVIYQKNGMCKLFVGEKARKFLASQQFEKIKITKLKELVGTCACPGKAEGNIKVINVPEEMGKMKPGDIMLSHTTFPALVPAMRKAAAIVTEDGGITCHAAIVSRELKIPCVVGIASAQYVLKDGDKVLVDAEKGTVKKIS